MDKKKGLTGKALALFSLAVILTRMYEMGDFVLYPITSELYKAFPEDTALVNYIISGPSLILLPMSLLTPYLARRFGKWKVIVAASVLMAVGGIFGVAFPTAPWMAFTRTLIGLGWGLMSVVSVTVVSDAITEPDKLVRYTGMYNASGNMGAVLFSLGSGALAAYGWQKPFLLYLLGIPMLAAVILFIPKDMPAARPAKKTEKTAKKKARLGVEFWMVMLVMATYSFLRTIVSYYMSLYVDENGLGGSGIAALAASSAQIFAFCGAMSSGFVYKKLGKWIMPVTSGALLVAMLLWTNVISGTTVFLVYCLACGASGMLMGFSYSHTLLIVPQEGVDTAVAILGAASGIACFLPTYFITWLMGLFNTSTVTPVLVVPEAIAFALFAVALLYVAATRKRDYTKAKI